MTIRSMLEKILTAPKVPAPPDIGTTVNQLAPLMEKAARRAYMKGWADRSHRIKNEDNGVAVFVSGLTDD